MLERALAKDAAFDGRFVLGIATTGIYCRPSCPARRPRPENVRFFPDGPAARAAGFRPCLRCAPDRPAGDPAAEAQELEALLDRLKAAPGSFARVEDLARALGLGPTRLAELCRKHLHRSPAQVLQRIRVAWAARRLRTTEEPLGALALEAGFGSLSAFHDAFRKGMALTPQAWRNLDAAGFTLRLPPEYRVEDTLAFHGRDPLSHCERVEGRRLTKAVAVAGRAGLLHLTFGNGRVAVSAPGLDGADVHALALRMLGLHTDPGPFERAALRGSPLEALVRQRPGLRLPQAATAWEALVWAILGQQVNLAFAGAMRRDLVARFGDPAGAGLSAHPGPEALAEAPLEDLTALRISRAKAETLRRAARAVAEGALPLERLREGSALEARRSLMGLKGIGPWTAAYTLLRGLGFPDCVPVGDAGLTLALQRQMGLDHRPGPGETEALLAPYAPWRSFAVYHLWSSLKGGPA